MTLEGEKTRGGMTEAEMRDNLVRLVFGGDARKLDEFCGELGRAVPLDTAAVVRGSSVTGVRAADGAPFDADGPGTSDVDLTLVGGDIIDLYSPEAFYIPGAHTKPLSDEDPDIALAATINDAAPDLVVFQEATRPDVVARLAGATGMKHWAATAGHSVGFMSRIEVAHHAWHRPPACRRALLEIVLGGSNARVFGVHLSAVHSNWTERRRIRELKALLAAIAHYQEGFHVLAGDFNTLAPGEKLDLRRLPWHLQVVALIGGRSIRWETIQVMLDAQYVDGYRSLNPGAAGYTFPTWDPHVRIDYVFLPGAAAQRLRRCEVIDKPTAGAASDHFPLLAEPEA